MHSIWITFKVVYESYERNPLHSNPACDWNSNLLVKECANVRNVMDNILERFAQQTSIKWYFKHLKMFSIVTIVSIFFIFLKLFLTDGQVK